MNLNRSNNNNNNTTNNSTNNKSLHPSDFEREGEKREKLVGG